MTSICGMDCCSACARKDACGGCVQTGGHPLGGSCIAAECVEKGGREALLRFKAALIEEIWEQFERYYAVFLQTQDLSGLVKEYEAHLVNMHQSVRVIDPKEPFEGRAMGITPRGELMVDTWESRRLVSAGEVSVRGIYGYV